MSDKDFVLHHYPTAEPGYFRGVSIVVYEPKKKWWESDYKRLSSSRDPSFTESEAWKSAREFVETELAKGGAKQ